MSTPCICTCPQVSQGARPHPSSSQLELLGSPTKFGSPRLPSVTRQSSISAMLLGYTKLTNKVTRALTRYFTNTSILKNGEPNEPIQTSLPLLRPTIQHLLDSSSLLYCQLQLVVHCTKTEKYVLTNKTSTVSLK